MATPKLTIQDERFAQLLFAGIPQRQAFLQIRPSAAQWSENAQDSNASKLARKVSIRLEQLRSKMEKKFEVSQEKVLEEYTQAGFAEIADAPTFADKHAALKGIREILGYDAPKKTENNNPDSPLMVEVLAKLDRILTSPEQAQA